MTTYAIHQMNKETRVVRVIEEGMTYDVAIARFQQLRDADSGHSYFLVEEHKKERIP